MEIQNTSLEVLRECKYNKYDIGMVSITQKTILKILKMNLNNDTTANKETNNTESQQTDSDAV